MKLYKLTIQIPMVVLAETKMDAKLIANQYLVDEARNMSAEEWSDADEVLTIKDLPEHWDEYCFPYTRREPPKEPAMPTIKCILAR